VVTELEAHALALARLCGDRVIVEPAARSEDELVRAFGSWSAQGRQLAVFYAIDHNGEQPERCDLVELEGSVTCTVIIREPAAGVQTLIGGYKPMSADVELERPLGDRTVIDGSSGEPRPSLAALRAR